MTKHMLVQARTDKIIKLIMDFFREYGGGSNAQIREYVTRYSRSAVPHRSFYKQLKKLSDDEIIKRVAVGIYVLVRNSGEPKNEILG